MLVVKETLRAIIKIIYDGKKIIIIYCKRAYDLFEILAVD